MREPDKRAGEGRGVSSKAVTPAILSPSHAAARLGIPVPGLVALIRRGRYLFTEIAPGGRHGDRGRSRWGLTEARLQKIIDGQQRGFREPEPEPAAVPVRVSASPDGKLRLRKGRARAMKK